MLLKGTRALEWCARLILAICLLAMLKGQNQTFLLFFPLLGGVYGLEIILCLLHYYQTQAMDPYIKNAVFCEVIFMAGFILSKVS